MTNPTALQKANEMVTQLNAALLQKDQLMEQLELTNDRVKALRNVLAGLQLAQEVAKEQAETQPADNA
jgi:hypothetical protein